MRYGKFVSNRQPFMDKHAALKDMILGHMSMDIETALKTTAGMPVSNTIASGNKRGGGGHMRAATRHFKSSDGKWRVEVNKSYAAYQERGMRKDGSHVVRNYTTAGTGSGFFKRAIAVVVKNQVQYISEARRAFNV